MLVSVGCGWIWLGWWVEDLDTGGFVCVGSLACLVVSEVVDAEGKEEGKRRRRARVYLRRLQDFAPAAGEEGDCDL